MRKGTRTGKYRSKMEARLAPQLEALGAKYESEKLRYAQVRDYTPDFTLPNGVIIEIKGYFPASDRTKMLAIKAAHPDRDIRFILATPRAYLTPAKRMTQGGWCEKHGFPYYDNEAPVVVRAMR